MEIGDRLVVDGNPVLACVGNKTSLFIKFIDRIAAQVRISVSGIRERVEFKIRDQIPLLLVQPDLLFAVFHGPCELGRVEVVLCQILLCIFRGKSAVREERVAVLAHSGDRTVIAAEESGEQRADQFICPGAVQSCKLTRVIAEKGVVGVAGSASGRLAADLKACELADTGRVVGIHSDLIISPGHTVHVFGAASVREVDRKSVCIGHIEGCAVVFDRPADHLRKFLALFQSGILGKMDQVDLIDLGIGGKFPRLVSGLGDLLIILVGDRCADRFGEAVQFVRNRIAQLCQVNDRQCRLLSLAFPAAGRHKGVYDLLSDIQGGHRCVPAKFCQPVRVVPADAGLCLFRGDHIVRVFIQHERCLCGCHQARVKTDKVKLYAAFIQRFLNA